MLIKHITNFMEKMDNPISDNNSVELIVRVVEILPHLLEFWS